MLTRTKDRVLSLFKRPGAVSALLIVGILLGGSVALADITSGLSTTSVSSNVTYTLITLAEPSDALAGDVLLSNISINGGTSAMVTPPSGWNLIARTDNDTNVRLVSYWKVVGASESAATYTWTINSQTQAAGGITRYSGLNTSNPIDVVGSSTGRGTVATAPSITTTQDGDEIVTLFATNVGTNHSAIFGTTTGMTKKYDSKNTPFGPTTMAEDTAQTVAGVVGAKASTFSTGVQRDWAAQQIALRKQQSNVVVEAWGGGGAGASYYTNSAGGGGGSTNFGSTNSYRVDAGGGGGGGDYYRKGGGGGGGYGKKTIAPILNNAYVITVGQGGQDNGTGGIGFYNGANGSSGNGIGGGGAGSSGNGSGSTGGTVCGGGGGGANGSSGGDSGNGNLGGGTSNKGSGGNPGAGGGSGGFQAGGGGGAGNGCNGDVNGYGGGGGAVDDGNPVATVGGGGGGATNGANGDVGGKGGDASPGAQGGKGGSGYSGINGGAGNASYGMGGDYEFNGSGGAVVITAPLGTVTATGGTHTSDANNDYWTFTSNGTWTPTSF